MKRSRFKEEQVIGVLREQKAKATLGNAMLKDVAEKWCRLPHGERS